MKHSHAFIKLVNQTRPRINRISAQELMDKFNAAEEFILIDIREDSEWAKGRIAGAVHLCKGIIERDIHKYISGKKSEIILYCGGGYRSVLAADNLQKMGYLNVSSMDGGWRRWKMLRYPVTNK